MTQRRLEYVRLDELRRHPRNPEFKDHDEAGIAASVNRHGFVEPPIVDERTDYLLGGHGRLEHLETARAAGQEPPEGIDVADDGMWLVPTILGWSSRSDAEALALMVALNRLPEAGGWKPRGLADLLDEISHEPLGLDGTGFSDLDLDAMLAELNRETEPDPPDDAEPAEPSKVAKRAAAQDIWLLGDHRLMCGDSRSPDDVAALLDGATINIAVTSPPYADRRDYDETSGFLPVHPDAYVEWFAPIAANVAAHLAGDGSWFVNIKPTAEGLDTSLYVLDLVAAHVREWGWHFATEFCWERVGVPAGVALRFKNQFEPVYQFARDRWKIRPQNVRHRTDDPILPAPPGGGNGGLADWQGTPGDVFAPQRRRAKRKGGGVDLADVQGGNGAFMPENTQEILDGWAYPGNRLPNFSGTHEATGHAAAYPVGLPTWFISAYTDPGDVVYDPFVGSGSTLLAAHNTKRVGYGMEISPAYCDVILDRWLRATGIEPTRM